MSAPPTMQPTARSSNVAEVGHDGTALWVRFKGGGLYRYPTAGAEHHKALLDVDSPGRYFAQNIRYSHRGEKVA